MTNKKDRKKEKAKDGKKEGSDDNENGDDYGMFHLLETFSKTDNNLSSAS